MKEIIYLKSISCILSICSLDLNFFEFELLGKLQEKSQDICTVLLENTNKFIYL